MPGTGMNRWSNLDFVFSSTIQLDVINTLQLTVPMVNFSLLFLETKGFTICTAYLHNTFAPYVIYAIQFV